MTRGEGGGDEMGDVGLSPVGVWNIGGTGGGDVARHGQGDGPASSLGCVCMGTEQCAVVIALVISS